MSEPKGESLVQLGVPGVVSRRQAMQWVLTAISASALAKNVSGAAGGSPLSPFGAAATQSAAPGMGYGRDPRLATIYKPGDFWPLTFTAAQRITAGSLADTIIPADHLGPAASEVGVVDMLDEWVSAPYAQQQKDRPIILDGLTWLETESNHRFTKHFSKLSPEQKQAICDDICFTPQAKPVFLTAAHFFSRFRSLCAGAYYATPVGWKAIGYVGNIALERFEGPPVEVLQRLGLT